MAKLKYTVNGPGAFVVKGLIESVEFRPAAVPMNDRLNALETRHADEIIEQGEINRLVAETLDRIQQNLDAVSARFNRDPLAPVAAGRAHISLGEQRHPSDRAAHPDVLAKTAIMQTLNYDAPMGMAAVRHESGELGLSEDRCRRLLHELQDEGCARYIDKPVGSQGWIKLRRNISSQPQQGARA